MGQAKLRKAAVKGGCPVPRDLIAQAVREPLLNSNRMLPPGFYSGTCTHQAVVGSRVLRLRYRLECTLQVGDFMRPLGDDLYHTYTRDDGQVRVETGAYHAWLFCRNTEEIIDFAAWEAPARMEREGHVWPAAKPDYLWGSLHALADQGFIIKPDSLATQKVIREIKTGWDGAFLDSYMADALAIIDAA